MCFKSRVKKRRSDWWWQRCWWQCGSDLCRVVRRWKTRMWMRLTERVREFITRAACWKEQFVTLRVEPWGSRWSGYGDNRRGSSTARRLNSDQFRKIRRLRGSKNFISEREKLILWELGRLKYSELQCVFCMCSLTTKFEADRNQQNFWLTCSWTFVTVWKLNFDFHDDGCSIRWFLQWTRDL